MARAPFIVLEGIDGAGTTTHTARLVSALRGRGLKVHSTREPTEGPIGVLLRQILTGRVVTPGPAGNRPPSWSTLGLLFAADRLDHLDVQVIPRLEQGTIVVSDRYDFSSIAYQGLSAKGESDPVAWLRRVNRFARRPDLTLVLDVPHEVGAARRRGRSGHEEIFDAEEFQRQLGGFYANVEQWFPEDRIVHVAADRDLEEVSRDILAHALAVVEGG